MLKLTDNSPASYWAGCAQGALRLSRCEDCQSVQMLGTQHCSTCWSAELAVIEAQLTGTLVADSVVHRAPRAELESLTPYRIGVVKLDAGPYLQIWVGDPRDDVDHGRGAPAAVTISFVSVNGCTYPVAVHRPPS